MQYLSAGVLEIWIVYEKARTIHVFRGGEKPEALVCDECGTFASALGFPVIVKDLFR